jgi:hypothetical protein
MKSPKKKPTAAKLRNWRVSILRNRAEYLGIVQAADEGTAEKAAIEAFALDEDRRKRLPGCARRPPLDVGERARRAPHQARSARL